jgi:transcriptional regulator with XRE-family HTH domain
VPAKKSAAHEALGEAIAARRHTQGFSQEGFAHEVGLHRTYMGGVERGERNLGLTNIRRIADALGLSASDLLRLGEQREQDRRRHTRRR